MGFSDCLVANDKIVIFKAHLTFCIATGPPPTISTVNNDIFKHVYCMYVHIITSVKPYSGDFPGGRGDKNLPANEGDMRLIPDLGRLHVWSN